MDMLDDLPPGLYEMVIEERPEARGARLDIDRDTYTVRFETRTVDDIRALNPDRRSGESLFSTIKQVSEITERLYESLSSPAVRALSSEATARAPAPAAPAARPPVRVIGPQPVLAALPLLAEPVRQHRHPASEDNIFVQHERRVSTLIGTA